MWVGVGFPPWTLVVVPLPLMATALFWTFGLACLLGSLMAVLNRNPVRGALWLVFSLFCMAVLFAVLDAHLLAALEIMVYAGAVMVLFLFVIMLLNLREEELAPRHFTPLKALGVAILAWMGGTYLLMPMVKAGAPMNVPVAKGFGSVEGVGMVVFTDYLLPFEMTSVLLLAAVVGAVVVAKRKI